MPLGPLGLNPSCTNYTSIDVAFWQFQHAAGSADYALPQPCSANFSAAVLYLQGASIDFGIPTSVPVATSNGLRLVLGQ